MKKRARRNAPPLPAAIARGYERYLKIALALPGAEASTSYGTPSVKIRGKILSRWRTEAEGAVAIRCDFVDREILLMAQPEVFFLMEHYVNYPMILMRVDKAPRDVVVDLTERAWRLVAPSKLVRERDAASPAAKSGKRTTSK